MSYTTYHLACQPRHPTAALLLLLLLTYPFDSLFYFMYLFNMSYDNKVKMGNNFWLPLHLLLSLAAVVTSMMLCVAVEGFSVVSVIVAKNTKSASPILQSASANVCLENTDATTAITSKSTNSSNSDQVEDYNHHHHNNNIKYNYDYLSTVDTMEIKRRLLDLVPRMMGTDDDYRTVEAYVNTLEGRYKPVQTLPFFNMATTGEWQLLFSTNLLGILPRPNFRLRELIQRIDTDNFHGAICNKATWDLAEEVDEKDQQQPPQQPGFGRVFDASGTFSIQCNYTINQGARMVLDLPNHLLELAKGSVVPKDFQGLIGLLHRAIPKEMFDPTDHAMDTTYLDGDLRIVRMTGPRLEGVRDIFIRRGSMEVNPV
jgi:hypothetical protein